jgi:SulP family sulfate permease
MFFLDTSMPTFLAKINQNWKSGLTLALISIPASISIAIACKATPTMGIITAVWAGLVASIVGGSNYNVIGVTGAIAGILATYAIRQGACNLPILTMVAGIFIVVAWALRLERFLRYVPASTIQGFTLGVASIIALNQLNFAFGLQNLPQHHTFVENTLESLRHVLDFLVPTTFIFFMFLFILFWLLKFRPAVPGIIVTSLLGIVFGCLAEKGFFSFHFLTLKSVYGQLHAKLIEIPSFCFNEDLIVTSLTVATIAILETMISAKIADDTTHTHYNMRAEMLGLGLANIVTGVMGGIPATGTVARSSINIRAGATHKMSQGISSCAIAIISVFLLPYFSYMPLPVIAAILVFAAVRMVERQHFIHMFLEDRKNFWMALFVALICIFKNPLTAIFVGTALSLLLFGRKPLATIE